MDQICIIKLIKDKENLWKFVSISIFLLSSLCNNNSSYEILWFDYKSTNFLSSRNFPRFQRNKLTQFVIITISQGALYEICIPLDSHTWRRPSRVSWEFNEMHNRQHARSSELQQRCNHIGMYNRMKGNETCKKIILN